MHHALLSLIITGKSRKTLFIQTHSIRKPRAIQPSVARSLSPDENVRQKWYNHREICGMEKALAFLRLWREGLPLSFV